MGFLQVFELPKTNMVNGDPKWAVCVNMSVNGCLFLCVSPVRLEVCPGCTLPNASWDWHQHPCDHFQDKTCTANEWTWVYLRYRAACTSHASNLFNNFVKDKTSSVIYPVGTVLAERKKWICQQCNNLLIVELNVNSPIAKSHKTAELPATEIHTAHKYLLSFSPVQSFSEV